MFKHFYTKISERCCLVIACKNVLFFNRVKYILKSSQKHYFVPNGNVANVSLCEMVLKSSFYHPSYQMFLVYCYSISS